MKFNYETTPPTASACNNSGVPGSCCSLFRTILHADPFKVAHTRGGHEVVQQHSHPALPELNGHSLQQGNEGVLGIVGPSHPQGQLLRQTLSKGEAVANFDVLEVQVPALDVQENVLPCSR